MVLNIKKYLIIFKNFKKGILRICKNAWGAQFRSGHKSQWLYNESIHVVFLQLVSKKVVYNSFKIQTF